MKNKLEIIERKIDDLIGSEYNPRKLSQEQFDDLKDSITRFGFIDPIIINVNKDRKGIVIGGHSRLKVAKSLGLKTIPTVELDLTLDKEKELNIRLNKNTGAWDFEALTNYFEKDNLVEWGFEADELEFFEVEENVNEDIKDLSDELCIEYKLEINLENEERQESLFNRLTQEGYKCRILTL